MERGRPASVAKMLDCKACRCQREGGGTLVGLVKRETGRVDGAAAKQPSWEWELRKEEFFFLPREWDFLL